MLHGTRSGFCFFPEELKVLSLSLPLFISRVFKIVLIVQKCVSLISYGSSWDGESLIASGLGLAVRTQPLGSAPHSGSVFWSPGVLNNVKGYPRPRGVVSQTAEGGDSQRAVHEGDGGV